VKQAAKKIGVREIARLAKVSIGTVDRALNGRAEVSVKTRQRILAIARDHGYRPNLNARVLSTGRPAIRIGVSIPREIRQFYDQVRQGIQDEAGRFQHAGVELLHRPAERLGLGEARAIRYLLDCGVQALILTPGNSSALAPLIDEAEQLHNVRVLCVASDDSLSCRSTAVSVEPRLNGMLAAELLAKFLPAAPEVAVITGMLATEDHCRKVDGFSEVFLRDSPGGRIAAVIEGHENDAETFAKCASLLRERPALAGLYVSTVNCLPVCRALKAAGKAGKIRLITTDLFAEAVAYVQDGTIAASIYQQPYLQGKTAIGILIDHFVDGVALPHSRYLDPAIVMRSNVALFREASALQPVD
jgi:LacI family transcriptional regulator